MSLIIKMDTIKTEEHLRKSIPYIMDERKTDGLCFSNAGITPEQILDTFFLTKQMHPTHGTRQGYHFKFSFSKDETIAPEDALSFVREWVEEYLGDHYDYACSVHKDRDHMHMHLVFNSVARNGGKYRYEKGDWEKVIRPLTNRLAEKYHTGPLKEKDPALDYSPDYDRKQGTARLCRPGGDPQEAFCACASGGGEYRNLSQGTDSGEADHSHAGTFWNRAQRGVDPAV